MSTEENQTNPLAPPEIYQRSDEEFAANKTRSPSPREYRSSKCCVYILLWVVIQAAIALIVALVVFRVESPQLRLSDVAVQNLQYTTSPVTSINASLTANVTVKNTNFGRYKFESASISVVYEGRPIGDAILISAGRARARNTKKVNVTIEARSSWLGSDDLVSRNLTTDLDSGTLQLSTHAKLRGKVNVMGIVKRRKTSEMNCTITLNLSGPKVQNVRCR